MHKQYKGFWKTFKPCHIGIHWKALTEHSQMSTHVAGVQSFFERFFASFCIDEISHQQISVKPFKPCHIDIHWIALTEQSQMSTHVAGLQSFFERFLASFCIDEISHQQMSVKPFKPCHIGIHWIALTEHSGEYPCGRVSVIFWKIFCIILYCVCAISLNIQETLRRGAIFNSVALSMTSIILKSEGQSENQILHLTVLPLWNKDYYYYYYYYYNYYYYYYYWRN